MLPSLGQHDLRSPAAYLTVPSSYEYLGSQATQQRQATVTKRDIDPANVQISPMREERVDGIAVIGVGAPRPEYRERLGSATKGAGINTYSVAEARTTILQAECKR
jgi:hypothetical protein